MLLVSLANAQHTTNCLNIWDLVAYSGDVRCAKAYFRTLNRAFKMSSYLPAMAIALQICSALGHADLIDYFLTKLPFPIQKLNIESNRLILQAKGINVPKIGHYRQDYDLIGVALVVNQPQILCYFLSKVSIVGRYDEQPHWRPSATGIKDNLRDYEICTSPRCI